MTAYWRRHRVFIVCVLALIAVVIWSLIAFIIVDQNNQEQRSFEETSHAIQLTNDFAPTWVLPIVSQAAWTATNADASSAPRADRKVTVYIPALSRR